MSTTWEKFQNATLSLVRSGPIKDRLTDAYRNYLDGIDDSELPRELREEFLLVARALTRERPQFRGEDAVRATIRKMSSEEADRHACSIVRLFGALPHTVGVGRATASVVPLYGAEA